jgi:hypothetical protein
MGFAVWGPDDAHDWLAASPDGLITSAGRSGGGVQGGAVGPPPPPQQQLAGGVQAQQGVGAEAAEWVRQQTGALAVCALLLLLLLAVPRVRRMLRRTCGWARAPRSALAHVRTPQARRWRACLRSSARTRPRPAPVGPCPRALTPTTCHRCVRVRARLRCVLLLGLRSCLRLLPLLLPGIAVSSTHTHTRARARFECCCTAAAARPHPWPTHPCAHAPTHPRRCRCCARCWAASGPSCTTGARARAAT